ncbi:DUF6427 family protein [Mesonia maritima]|uniref:Uncharacterized protein n=1 Tax=Mesonia maritima TaxID=1793873 RepID=A0ABU1K3E1_9FLAO|nr:DUF6427 family protein [Mesonia maritima]MDR6299826.1 hypothetical protein [Mesonia maritima]
MLTNFFKRSKPIQFLLVGIYMSVFFIIANFFNSSENLSTLEILKNIGFLIVYLASMSIINFLVKRSGVTKKNTFTIILFAVFTLSFFPVLRANYSLLSAFFLLLGLRRIINLKTGINYPQKIFDATLWISIASLFYFPCVCFLILPYLGILFYTPEKLKYWLIPIVALFTVVILNFSFQLLVDDQISISKYIFSPNYDFDLYRKNSILFPLSVLLAFSFWVLFNYFKRIQNSIKRQKKGLYLILFTWIISIFIIVISPTKTGGELIFYSIPVSIMGASYFEQKGEKWLKEILLLTLVLITFIIPFLI